MVYEQQMQCDFSTAMWISGRISKGVVRWTNWSWFHSMCVLLCLNLFQVLDNGNDHPAQ